MKVFLRSAARRSPALVLALALIGNVAGLADDVLMGRLREADILSISPEWQSEYDDYTPSREDLKAFATLPRGTTLDVYLGSWCDDSRRGVPRLLRILHDAPTNHMAVRLFGVDLTKTEPARLLRDVGLERVPTLVLRLEGREIGRIIETPRTTLEHDLSLLAQEAHLPAEP